MKKKLIWFLVFSLVGFFAGYILTNSLNFNLCSQNDYPCRDLMNNIGDPLVYGMPALALVFFTLLFTPRAFDAWKKFAVWFIPLAALLFIFYPDPSSGDYFSPYPEQVFKWVSVLYIIISLILIIYKSLKKN